MKTNPFYLIGPALAVALSSSPADVIQWAQSQGTISKSFDDKSAEFTLNTSTNGVTFEIEREGRGGSMRLASQWAADRWPPAPDFSPANGDFNVVSNANNDIVLGLTGFYGEFGDGRGAAPQIGDSVSFSLTIEFENPVTALGFQLNNINALTKPTGFNSKDTMVIQAFLGRSDAGSPEYTNEGTGYIRTGDELVGDWNNRIGLNNPAPYDIADQHVTDEGSVNLTFNDPVDSIKLTLTNVAENLLDPDQYESFNDPNTAVNEALQTWAFSIGDVSFTTIPEPSSLTLLGFGLLLLVQRQRRN